MATVSDFLGRPLTQPMSLVDVSSKHIAQLMKEHVEQQEKGISSHLTNDPHEAAIMFYGLNHAAAVILADKAPDDWLSEGEEEILNLYYRTQTEMTARVFYYLMGACLGEMRHMHQSDKTSKAIAELDDSVRPFWQHYSGLGGSRQVARMWFMGGAPEAPFGHLINGMVTCFNKGSWGGAFGGKKWGAIAECIRKMVFAETSPEIMVDISFSLQHNTASVYNKNFIFNCQYGQLGYILDLQRAGQMPNFILTKDMHNKVSSHIATRVTTVFEPIQKILGSKFWDGTSVDLKKAKKLGALHLPDEPKGIVEEAKESIHLYKGMSMQKVKSTRKTTSQGGQKNVKPQNQYAQVALAHAIQAIS